eukprot:GHVU01000627.1.p4 GENE.GHVU01000627.1~~GHVU01000627.1.p4  ORF type:complete len:106 (-),score=11.37 GHVU01000627.1:974-1291(-)
MMRHDWWIAIIAVLSIIAYASIWPAVATCSAEASFYFYSTNDDYNHNRYYQPFVARPESKWDSYTDTVLRDYATLASAALQDTFMPLGWGMTIALQLHSTTRLWG